MKQYRCKQRNAAFSRRVKIVEQDAHKQRKVGTKKDGVARFYTEHKIPFDVVRFKDVGSEAIGTPVRRWRMRSAGLRNQQRIDRCARKG